MKMYIIYSNSSHLICLISNSPLADHRKVARQGAAQNLLVPVAPGDLSDGEDLPSLANCCVRYASVAQCVAPAGGVGAARRFARVTVDADLGALWRFVALH